MTIYFVSRHDGALQWAKMKGLAFDVHLTHLTDLDDLHAHDVVIGTLPIQLVCQLNGRGIRYVHLSLNIPVQLRGIELTAAQLMQCQASLEEYNVQQKSFDQHLLRASHDML